LVKARQTNELGKAEEGKPDSSLRQGKGRQRKAEEGKRQGRADENTERYTDVVLLCLRCLDSGSGANHDGQGFGVGAADYTDEDGVMIGVSYIENVLEKMQGIIV
jgi:hypothetical protein